MEQHCVSQHYAEEPHDILGRLSDGALADVCKKARLENRAKCPRELLEREIADRFIEAGIECYLEVAPDERVDELYTRVVSERLTLSVKSTVGPVTTSAKARRISDVVRSHRDDLSLQRLLGPVVAKDVLDAFGINEIAASTGAFAPRRVRDCPKSIVAVEHALFYEGMRAILRRLDTKTLVGHFPVLCALAGGPRKKTLIIDAVCKDCRPAGLPPPRAQPDVDGPPPAKVQREADSAAPKP